MRRTSLVGGSHDLGRSGGRARPSWLGEGGETAEKKLAKRVETGWPSSTHGVWVLEYDLEDRAHYELRMGASLLANCLNMDERCQIIQDLGGAFYPNPDQCEALRPLAH